MRGYIKVKEFSPMASYATIAAALRRIYKMNLKRQEIRAMVIRARGFEEKLDPRDADGVSNLIRFFKIKEMISDRFKSRHENVDEIIKKALEGGKDE